MVTLNAIPANGGQLGAWDGACAAAADSPDAALPVSHDASCVAFFAKGKRWDDARAHFTCHPLTFSPGGGVVLCGNELLGARSGRKVYTGPSLDHDLLFSDDGLALLSLSGMHEVDLVTGAVTPIAVPNVGALYGVAVSPDGRRWAAINGDGHLVIVDSTTLTARVFPEPGVISGGAFDGSGKRFLAESFSEVLIIDVDSESVVARHPVEAVGTTAWTSDGRLVSWTDTHTTGSDPVTASLHLWDTQSDVDTVLTQSAMFRLTPAIRRDGREVAALESDGHVGRWALPSLALLPDVTVPMGRDPTVESSVALAYSPDGSELAFSTEQFDGVLALTTQQLRIFHAGTFEVTQIAWSAAEDLIESVDLANELVTYDAASGRITDVSDAVPYSAVSRSPDGRWRAFSNSDGTTAEDLGSGATPLVSPHTFTRLDFSPDSQWLFAGSDDEVELFRSGDFGLGATLPHLLEMSGWADRGSALLGVDSSGFVRISPETGQVLAKAPLANVDVQSLRVGASALSGIAAADVGESLLLWDSNSATPPTLVTTLDTYADFAAPSPDGTLVLVGGQGTNVYDDEGKHVTSLAISSRSARWSLSGTRVAVGGVGYVRVFARVEWP